MGHSHPARNKQERGRPSALPKARPPPTRPRWAPRTRSGSVGDDPVVVVHRPAVDHTDDERPRPTRIPFHQAQVAAIGVAGDQVARLVVDVQVQVGVAVPPSGPPEPARRRGTPPDSCRSRRPTRSHPGPSGRRWAPPTPPGQGSPAPTTTARPITRFIWEAPSSRFAGAPRRDGYH